MLSVDYLLKNPTQLEELLRIRKITDLTAEQILLAIRENQMAVADLQKLQEQRNLNTASVEKLLKNQQREQALPIIAKQKTLNKKIQSLQEAASEKQKHLENLLLQLPNWLDADVPPGDDSQNVPIRQFGKPPTFSFPAKTHFDIGETCGYLHPVRSAKISGARFSVYRQKMAKLERVLMNFMIDLHTQEFGYTEVHVPQLVLGASMQTAGQYPRFRGEYYSLASLASPDSPDSLAPLAKEDGLHLIPTAEVALVNLYRDEILQEHELPIAVVAFSSCFRREAGAAGKDTRGLIRLHQFQKVELVQFCLPEDSAKIHMYMVEHAEEVLKHLQLPFRTVLKAADDTGITASKSYDLEVWMPGMNRWMEISSISNCQDFQSRRGKMRYRPRSSSNGKAKPEFVHTLNGSGLALGRTLIAIMENYQNESGEFDIPEALQKYWHC